MNEQEITRAMERLAGLQGRGINYELSAVRRVLSARSHPEKAFRSVIVAGTNGKGSTSAMLYAIMRKLGYRVGLYTSPHLIDITERMRMNKPIGREEFAEWILSYDTHGLLDELTYYEATTAIALDWFRDSEAEWAVLEVGVGGRLDSVNVAPAEGAVITTIALDHRDLLGDSIEAIAKEKAGVIKAGRPVITGALPQEAAQAVAREAESKGAPVFVQGIDWKIFPLESGGFKYEGLFQLEVPRLALVGDHQRYNAGCALAAAERIVGVDLSANADLICEALAEVEWPARFQKVSSRPLVLVDGAHNPAGARVLASTFREHYGDRPLNIAFASLAGKDHNAMIAALMRADTKFFLTDIPGEPRALPARELARLTALKGREASILTPRELLARLNEAEDEEAWLVTGSIAFAGWFLGKFGDKLKDA